MIIDGHVHLSDHPTPVYRHPPFTAEELIPLMDGPFQLLGRTRRVDMALIQPHVGETLNKDTDLVGQHEYILRCVKRYSDRLLGCVAVNPYINQTVIMEGLNRLIKGEGFNAIKLHATAHGYLAPRYPDLLGPIFTAAGELGVPVIIHTGEPPFSLPSLFAPFIEEFRATRIILAHMGTQMVSYASEAVYLAQKNDNVILDTSWASLPALKRAVTALGPERLIFGTDCPIQEIGTQMRTVEALAFKPPVGMNLEEKSIEKILGQNLVDLLGLRR